MGRKNFQKKGIWTGRYKTTAGYVFVYQPNHKNAQINGYVFEHVLVMSKKLGRPLLKHENVHHKNGVKDDNRRRNLELWSKSQPAGQRVSDKLKWAHEIIKLYDK